MRGDLNDVHWYDEARQALRVTAGLLLVSGSTSTEIGWDRQLLDLLVKKAVVMHYGSSAKLDR